MSAFEDVVDAWGFRIAGEKPAVLSPAGIAPDGSIVYSDAESFRDLIGAEPELGNPSVNGWILSSSSAGVRSWVAPSAHSHAIADVTGLQGALDARMATASYPDLVAIEALAGASGLLRKTAANTWSLDTASYALSSAIPAASSTTPSALGAAAVGTGTTWARADHAHAMPTAAQVGAAAASHSHAIADVTGLQTALDGRSLTSHNHNSLYLGISATAAAATKLATGRILTIGSTGKSFDGSANVSWSLAEIGAQPAGSYAAAVHGHAISDVTGLQSALDGKEPSLGNPSVSGHVLASTTAGVRSWVSLPTIPVTSVFGRTGAVVAASGDYTTAQVAESGNLYYTDARARAAISASAPLSYSGGVVSHLATDGNLHVPATSTTNNGKALVAGSTAGSIAWTSLAISHITGLQSALDAKLSTVTADASSRAANTVYAAPNGSAGTAAFRSLVAADIPSLDTSKLTSGTLGYARGGTGISAPGATAGNLRWSGSAYAIDTASYALSSAIPVASSTTPSALGTAAVGTGTTWARADHAHAMPTAAQVGAATASHNHDAAYLGISATAAAATKLATGRTIGITGDATWTSPTFDGTANVTAALTLASVITAGGPVGGAATVPVITYDAKGRLTAVTTATITPAAIGAQPAGSYASSSHNHTLDSLSNTTITSIATGELLRWNGTAWVNNTLAEAGIQPAGSYLTGNQTITLSGIVTGSGATAITTSIADAALSIAKTSGLQTALDARMSTASYPDLVAIEALAGTSGLLRKTAANTWSLDTASYLTTAGKAADSNLLDGKDPDLYVQGRNGSRTTNASPFGNIAKSGFYDSASAADSPTPNTWAYVIHAAHSSNPAAYAFQIAANFGVGNTEGYFLRMKNTSGTTAWRTIYHSGNLDAVVKNPSAEQKITGYALVVERSAASQAAFAAWVAGDTYGRVALTSDGPVEWGTGAAARDTSISRDASGRIKVAGTQSSSSYPGRGIYFDGVGSSYRSPRIDLRESDAGAQWSIESYFGSLRFLTGYNSSAVVRGSFDASGNFNLANLTASRMVSTDASKNLVTLDAAGSRALIGAQSAPIARYGHASERSYVRIASITATSDWASYSSCFRASNRGGTFELFVRFATAASVAPVDEQAVSIGAGDAGRWRVKRITSSGAVSWEVWFLTREYAGTVATQQTTVHNAGMTETFPGNYQTTDPGWGSWVHGIDGYASLAGDNTFAGTNKFSPLSGSGTSLAVLGYDGTLSRSSIAYSSVATGSGEANRMAYWSETNVLSSSAKLQFDGSNLLLGNTAGGELTEFRVRSSALFDLICNSKQVLSSNGTATSFDAASSIVLAINGASKLSLSGGAVSVSDTIVPTLNNAYDLGSSTHRFANVHAANVYVGGAAVLTAASNITFPSSSRLDISVSDATLPDAPVGTMVVAFNTGTTDRRIYSSSGTLIISQDTLGNTYEQANTLVNRGGWILARVTATRWVVIGTM